MKNKKIKLGIILLGITASFFVVNNFLKKIKIKKYTDYLNTIKNESQSSKLSVFLGQKVYSLEKPVGIYNSVEYSDKILLPISTIDKKNLFLGKITGCGVNEDGYPYFFISENDVNQSIKSEFKFGIAPNPNIRFLLAYDVYVDSNNY